MKVLVTGSCGFIGKNLITRLMAQTNIEIYPFDLDTPPELLDRYCADCDFVFNLAGVNRPESAEEFMEGNFGFASLLTNVLRKHKNTCPIMNASSVQAVLDNPYGCSKKAGEDMLFAYGQESGVSIYNYRFTNVFGKWCRPGYNSVVATFCHNIAHDLPIKINDKNTILQLIYIDDLITELLEAMGGTPHMDQDGHCYVPQVYSVTLGEIADLLYGFKESRVNKMISDMSDGFEKKLYSTYLSYLPTDQFVYPLKMNTDERGNFTELFRTPERGQVSVNVSRPGIVKGNHWHHTKNEKFVVVSGKALIRFRKVGCKEIIEYSVSGDKIEVVDIPTGYIHAIANVGETDLVTIMWCNECFDPENPDTIHELVDLKEI